MALLFTGLWGLEIGQALPEVSLENLKGPQENIVFTQKYTIVDFWGSWCIPCRESLPHLEKEFSTQEDVLFVSISVDNEKRKAISFYETLKLSHQAYWDFSKAMIASLNPNGFPALYVFDSQGILLWKKSGYTLADTDLVKSKIKAGQF